ncbi:uncharacterized protein B0T15DRAFT_526286 [Chaetomium strumarium]|uniref:DUF1279 domain-containing protein n=1 Tax=Chaetomium strumarium TaxID=1170767 RepID=A0AAJ0GZR0_9PEZI|nr:hypothetical protein B0T15DRAFT_526286 [Chaetomium strumarium]
MLRSALGAIDALIGAGVTPGKIARQAVGNRGWMGKMSATGPVVRVPWQQRAFMSQLRTTRPTFARSRFGRPRSPFLIRPRRPFHSSRPKRADAADKTGNASGEPLSVSARMKKLSREYGWSAVGVYLALSVLDFPFCFLLVRTVGTEKIAHIEHVVVSNVKKIIPDSVETWWREYRQALGEAKRERMGETGETDVIYHGVEEAEKRSSQEGASLATQLALAYAIHKSFIFLRVPLTAAVTPKVVKVLRSWGWEIGKRRVKSPVKN